jgi:CRP-like cAMP-binding protein
MTELNPHAEQNMPADSELISDPAYVEHAARLLGDSELADNLLPIQIARLAAIAEIRAYRPGELVCDEHERSDELYIIESGTLEIWLDPASIGRVDAAPRRIAELRAGQTCGELALLDGGVRSAQVRSGGQGVRVTVFQRDTLLALCEADTAIGFRLMRNLASALALRLRLQDMRLYSDESS